MLICLHKIYCNLNIQFYVFCLIKYHWFYLLFLLCLRDCWCFCWKVLLVFLSVCLYHKLMFSIRLHIYDLISMLLLLILFLRMLFVFFILLYFLLLLVFLNQLFSVIWYIIFLILFISSVFLGNSKFCWMSGKLQFSVVGDLSYLILAYVFIYKYDILGIFCLILYRLILNIFVIIRYLIAIIHIVSYVQILFINLSIFWSNVSANMLDDSQPIVSPLFYWWIEINFVLLQFPGYIM